jgi:hypothetical protein
MKNMDITDNNFIDVLFKDCESSFYQLDSNLQFKHTFIDDNIDYTIYMTSTASITPHQSYNDQPYPTTNQIHEIFNYVSAELKQNVINEIRNGINDIVLTLLCVKLNPKYYKKLQHSIIKNGYEFELYIITELL